jgi:predicted nucleic acid-binding protein
MNAAPPIFCNAGPLMALGKLNRLDLLTGLYPIVQIPEVVYNEVVVDGLARGEADAAIVRNFWRQQQWPVVSVHDAVLTAYQPLIALGGGERAVLALAQATPGALALLDDALARREARRIQV